MEELTNSTSIHATTQNQDEEKKNLELTLPKERGSITANSFIFFYQGFWCPSRVLHNVIAFQKHFQAQDTDIIIATKPKSGTTWLKSLVFSAINRTHFTNSNHPLLSNNPHDLAPIFEYKLYATDETRELPDLSGMTSPRLFSTHIPYASLPESLKDSKCKIVYMGRNPYDTFVSLWEFVTRNNPKLRQEVTIEEYLECFCRGAEPFGPHWDHVLGYWKESLERPNKVLFLKYEDMKANGVCEMKKLAEFLGCGFSLEEEKQGVIEGILKLCSLSNLKELEVNKKGKYLSTFENKSFFRKGEVGDWINHLSPSMAEMVDQMVAKHFAGSSLEFKLRP